jgi:hypothetical protein
MKNNISKENKLFLAFGVITILSGLYLLFQGNYLIGASGTCVGFLIVYQNTIANTKE